MPGVNLSQPLLGAGAAAKNDWAAASARTSLDFTAQAEFKRGLNVTIGLSALAQADAGLAKFVEATVRGNAFAEAEASLQVQLPLNLFQSFGLAVGAQAKAQAAAGIEVGLALVVGDFIELIRRDPNAIGIPIELVLLLLEEVALGGKFEVHVAASAMAYASITITGTIIDRPGKPAGFEYLVDAGLGLAAGMGFSGGLTLGFRDFRHFYGRAVDLCVDAIVRELGSLLADEPSSVRALAGAFGPVAKLALRLAYELGDFIAKNNPGPSPEAALTLANHGVGILLEESQRFLLEHLVATGLNAARRVVQGLAGGMGQSAWDAVRPQRRAVAQRLYAVPADPFQPTTDNRAYWRRLQEEMLALANGLPAGVRDSVKQGAAAVGVGAELLMEMFRSRINAAQAYVVAVGVGQITTKPAFGGPLPQPMLPGIQEAINTALGQAAGAALDFGTLTRFLTRPALLDALRSELPGIDRFAQIFSGPMGRTATQVLATFLSNREAFLPDANGHIDPRRTLEVLLQGLDGFITDRLNAELKARVYAATPDELTRLYFDEVLLAAINFAKDVAFRTVLDWDKAPVDKDTFTEALASVLTMLVGRSVVIIGDQFFDALARNMQAAAAHAAGHLEGRKSVFDAIGLPASPELERLFADTVRIGGEVFGPLPDDTRARIRGILYEIMEPLPPNGARAFVDDLGDQFFIPNGEHVDALRDELLAISRERFGRFAEKVLEGAGSMLLEALADFIAEALATIRQWEKDIAKAIEDLGRAVAQLAEEIAHLVEEMEAAFGQAVDAFEALLETLASGSMRSKLKTRVVDELYARGKGILRDNPVYQALPKEFRSAVKALLKDTIRGLVNSPIVDPVLDVIGQIAGALDDVVDDVRALDPHRPLAEQVLELTLSRVEDAVRGHFGSTKPHVSVGFEFSYEFFGHQSVRVELGRVEIPFSTFFAIVRSAVNALGDLDDALEDVATKLAAAFAKQFDVEAKEDERAGKRRDRERLAAIDREHSAAPKEIAVLTPADGSVHGGDVRVEIHLGGVPASYLGLDKDEQQRVFILLNGEMVTPKSLVVGAAAAADPGVQSQDFHLAALPGFDAGAAVFRGPGATIRLGGEGASGAPAPPPAAPIGLGRARGLGLDRRVVAPTGGGKPTTSTRLANFLPGRPLPPSSVREIAASLPPGTTLSFTVEMKDLLQGANTLTVLVLDRGGRQYQQIVSFGVTPPPKAPTRGTTAARLPVRGKTGRGTPARGAPAKPRVGAGTTPAAIRSGLGRATSYVKSQAKLNFTAFKGKKS
jgi:hypothetical protein